MNIIRTHDKDIEISNEKMNLLIMFSETLRNYYEILEFERAYDNNENECKIFYLNLQDFFITIDDIRFLSVIVNNFIHGINKDYIYTPQQKIILDYFGITYQPIKHLRISDIAAKNGDIDLLKYCYEQYSKDNTFNECKIDIVTMEFAAKYSTKNCVEFLYKNNCSIDQSILDIALQNGNLETAKFLFEIIKNIDSITCERIAYVDEKCSNFVRQKILEYSKITKKQPSPFVNDFINNTTQNSYTKYLKGKNIGMRVEKNAGRLTKIFHHGNSCLSESYFESPIFYMRDDNDIYFHDLDISIPHVWYFP